MPIVDKHVRIAEHVTASAKAVGLTKLGWIVYYDPTPITEKGCKASVECDVVTMTAVVRFSRAGLRRKPAGRNELLAHELTHIHHAIVEAEIRKLDLTEGQYRKIMDEFEIAVWGVQRAVSAAMPPWPEDT